MFDVLESVVVECKRISYVPGWTLPISVHFILLWIERGKMKRPCWLTGWLGAWCIPNVGLTSRHRFVESPTTMSFCLSLALWQGACCGVGVMCDLDKQLSNRRYRIYMWAAMLRIPGSECSPPARYILGQFPTSRSPTEWQCLNHFPCECWWMMLNSQERTITIALPNPILFF